MNLYDLPQNILSEIYQYEHPLSLAQVFKRNGLHTFFSNT
jgi:hypothetical protein